MHPVFRYQKVSDVDVFYREAGPADGPVILALHGFPDCKPHVPRSDPGIGGPLSRDRAGPSGLRQHHRSAARVSFAYSFDNLAR